MKKNKIISNWLDENSSKEIETFIAKNLAIIEKVRLRLEEKKWTHAQLAIAMNKKPSEVSKWMTGMHNLTLKSIIKMEIALGIELIQTTTKNAKTKHKTTANLKKVEHVSKQGKSKAISIAI